MTTPKKTRPGAPFQFSAKFYNKLIDTVNWADTQKNLAGSGQQGGARSETKLMVKNNSGDSVLRFGVLEVTDKIGSAAEFRHLKTLQGEAPTSALGPVVVVQQAVADGKLTNAVAAGVTMARVNVQATSDTHAEPEAGETVLRSGTAGRFRILQPLTETGEQEVLVRFESASQAEVRPRIKNVSGYQVPPWGFLMIDGVETTPTADLDLFKSAPVFRGVSPSPLSVFAGKRVVSVPGGANIGETVDCILDGRVPANIYSDTKTDPVMCHVYGANSINDVTYLRAKWDQTNFGFPILYRETGTGAKWGLIDLMPQNQPAVVVGYWRRGMGSGFTNIPAATNLGTDVPYVWQGNPFQVDGASLFRNGTTKLDVYPTDLRFAGPTTWMGVATLHFSVRYSSLQAVSGTPFLRQSGFEVKFGVLCQDWINQLNGFDDYGYYFAPPGVIHTSDVASLTYDAQQVSITVPFFFTNNSPDVLGIRFRIEANKTTSGSGLAFTPQNMTLSMHEVDPLLAQFQASSGTVSPVVAQMSSGSVIDPTTVAQKPVKSPHLRMGSGGLRGVASGSSGGGGGGGPVFE